MYHGDPVPRAPQLNGISASLPALLVGSSASGAARRGQVSPPALRQPVGVAPDALGVRELERVPNDLLSLKPRETTNVTLRFALEHLALLGDAPVVTPKELWFREVGGSERDLRLPFSGVTNEQRESDGSRLRDLLYAGRALQERLSPGIFGGVTATQADLEVREWSARVETELAAWPAVLKQFQIVTPGPFALASFNSVEYACLGGRLKVLATVLR